MLKRLGHPEIDPARLVGDTPGRAAADRLHGAGALPRRALIVMDEPSAALDPDEVDNLFRIVDDLTADGVAVVYISHRLEEIRRIGDRVTVLKDGRAVAGVLPAKSTPTREVVALMTGRDVEYVFPERPAAAPRVEPGAHRRRAVPRGRVRPARLQVRPGDRRARRTRRPGRSEILETI
ncbi:hypothetical protein GCM10023238_18000 [Streptomyces heliomycini]